MTEWQCQHLTFTLHSLIWHILNSVSMKLTKHVFKLVTNNSGTFMQQLHIKAIWTVTKADESFTMFANCIVSPWSDKCWMQKTITHICVTLHGFLHCCSGRGHQGAHGQAEGTKAGISNSKETADQTNLNNSSTWHIMSAEGHTKSKLGLTL